MSISEGFCRNPETSAILKWKLLRMDKFIVDPFPLKLSISFRDLHIICNVRILLGAQKLRSAEAPGYFHHKNLLVQLRQQAESCHISTTDTFLKTLDHSRLPQQAFSGAHNKEHHMGVFSLQRGWEDHSSWFLFGSCSIFS